MSIEDYEVGLREEVLRRADADGVYAEDAFFEIAAEIAAASGEVENLERAFHQGAKGSGIRVDGHGGDPLATGTLDLVILDYTAEPGTQRLTATGMNDAFRRATKFVRKALDGEWRRGIEETSPAFALADMIASRWSRISKIRLVLLTNRTLSERVDDRETDDLDGRPVSHSVWDTRRMHAFVSQGGEREVVEIDLGDHGGPFPILAAHAGGAEHESYLAVVPGTTLASIYDRWSARLLEQNVRVFLQARAGVNKGIRDTLAGEPSMFFAYNNGITATAEAISTRQEAGALLLTGLRDFQIVNGGQTTASIHAAMRSGIDLSRVAVQMKLSIVDRERAETVVPEISRFANTQNRVNAADFFATSALHVRIKDISQRLYAPPTEGSVRQSRWFYERARGQYAEARSRLTPALRKKFDLEHPRAQVLTKTDLAKFDLTWRMQPHVVSFGAQKCFAFYTKATGEEWNESPDQFSEGWFRDLVAKAIAFRALEAMTSRADWYTAGLRAQTVTYGLAKVVHDARAQGMAIDLRRVWERQTPTDGLALAMESAAREAHLFLLAPQGGSNPSEWAKKAACWKAFADVEVEYGGNLADACVTRDEARAERATARRDQKLLSGIEAQTAVVRLGAPFWQTARAWAREKKLTSQMEDGILEVASGTRLRAISEKQSVRAMAILGKLQEKGLQVPAS